MDTGSFPGVKSGPGVTMTPHRFLLAWPWKSRATPLLPLWTVRPVQSLSACTRVHFTFLNQNTRYEHKNNPPLAFHNAVFCDVTTRRHIPQDCHDRTKLRYYQLIPDFNKFEQIGIY